MDGRPIGICDSGFGGVSVLLEAMKRLPDENYIYYGDNKNAPYGDRDESEISQLAFVAANHLVECGVKTIVIACNTATGTAIREIRSRLELPVVSIEPAIKPACAQAGDGKILMLATLATTRLSRYRKLQESMPNPDRVINVPCSGLADRIERLGAAEDGFDDLLESYLLKYSDIEIDGIVLGCTHYVLIRNVVKRFAEKHLRGRCEIYDGNAGTVNQLKRVLEANNITNGRGMADVEFHTSGDTARFEPIFNEMLKGARKNNSICKNDDA